MNNVTFKVGDLVVGKGFEFHNHGVGIVMGVKEPVLKVFWLERGFWGYTGASGVEPLSK